MKNESFDNLNGLQTLGVVFHDTTFEFLFYDCGKDGLFPKSDRFVIPIDQ